jgi:hypothetical protein
MRVGADMGLSYHCPSSGHPEALEWYFNAGGPDSGYDAALEMVGWRYTHELEEHYRSQAEAGETIALWVFARIALESASANPLE